MPTKRAQSKWLYFWSTVFKLKTNQPYRHIMVLVRMILPAHEDWFWQYVRDHRPANDNKRIRSV